MSKEVKIYIGEDGSIVFVHDDEVTDAFAGQGRMVTCRASHVEPVVTSQLKRRGTQWEIDLEPTLKTGIMDGMTIGPFSGRAEALEAEVFWLELHFTFGVGWMTYNQLGKSIELKKQGWDPVGVLGDGEAIGSPLVVRDPDGRLHKIVGNGDVVPLREEEQWKGHSSSAPPGSPETRAATPTG